jgi:hypothetical protein
MLKESAELLGLLRVIVEKQLMPTSISLLELTELPPLQVSRGMTNAKSACTSLLNRMVDIIGNLFLPDNKDLLMRWWMSDGVQYSNGEQLLPAINYQKHPTNDQVDDVHRCVTSIHDG